MGAVEDTVRGLGCLAKGGGVIAIIIVVVLLVMGLLALVGLILEGMGMAGGHAMDFYAAHCDAIWAVIGVVFVLFVARHLGKKR